MPAPELTIHPIPTKIPPKATISRGPFFGPTLSTIQPWIGVSQVSSATNRLKAIWMSATAQPCATFIGRTNKVQPYCRLAIITMQTMPMISWSQRFAAGMAADGPADDALCMDNPPSDQFGLSAAATAQTRYHLTFLNGK